MKHIRYLLVKKISTPICVLLQKLALRIWEGTDWNCTKRELDYIWKRYFFQPNNRWELE